MERAAAVIGDVVGDIHQGVDGPEPNGPEALLHPVRRRTVLDVPDQAAGEEGAGIALGPGEGEGDGDGAVEPALALERGRRAMHEALGAQRAEAGGCEVAGDAAHAQAVRPVGGDGDLDHRIVEADGGGEGLAHMPGEALGQLDDAGVLVRELELALRAQHAGRFDPANGRLGERLAKAGNPAPLGREDADEALARIGRATHHLHLAPAGVHGAQLQLVGIRVGPCLDHAGNDEGREPVGRILDAFDLEPDQGELGGDFVELGLGLKMVSKPGQGEFHRLARNVVRLGYECSACSPWRFSAIRTLPQIQAKEMTILISVRA